MPALILAGHGSHISPHTAGLVWGCVDRLRALGVADEITACFWKEPPSFRGVLDTVQAREVVIVPVFTAQGYFTQTVIPAEMGLDGARTIRDGRVIHYARTLGEHPGLVAVVRQRVTETLAAAALDPQEVAVAVIGHGTPRSATSQDATRQQAAQLHAAGLVAEVFAVYLDDDPPIQSLYDTVRAPTIIAVPFFLAPGSHVKQDVPRALGLGESGGTVRGKRVFYTAPVGTAETLDTLMLDLARETGLPFRPSPDERRVARLPSGGSGRFMAGSAIRRDAGIRPASPDPLRSRGGRRWRLVHHSGGAAGARPRITLPSPAHHARSAGWVACAGDGSACPGSRCRDRLSRRAGRLGTAAARDICARFALGAGRAPDRDVPAGGPAP